MQGTEPPDRDDFDQPGIDALLRRLAGDVAHSEGTSDSEEVAMRGNIFQPPDDASELRRRMRDVDHRLESGEQSQQRPAMRRLYPILAAAAVLGLATGLYLYVQPNQVGARITQIALVSVGATRGQPPDEFRIGDEVQLEVTTSKSCQVYIVVLDSTGILNAPEPDRVYPLEPGAVRRLPPGENPLILHGKPGTESFLLLISEAPLDVSELRAIVEKAARDVKPEGKTHERLLADVLTELRRDSRIVVEVHTYQLMPASP